MKYSFKALRQNPFLIFGMRCQQWALEMQLKRERLPRRKGEEVETCARRCGRPRNGSDYYCQECRRQRNQLRYRKSISDVT